ncbi:hypothetical protein B0H13DRAFT_2320047 [Mycena leptocephala]|nr:hypothetical protein B0H13DRAFT_2320047 [Mycena leptocephala]
MLKFRIKHAAQAAADGSMQHLIFAKAIMATLPPERTIDLLPVFYSHLNFRNIPSIGALDALQPTWPVRKGTQMAVLALKGLYSVCDIPEDVCSELWPHVRQWVDFLFTFREQLHWLSLTERGICVDFLNFVATFLHSPTTAALFCRTKGFCFIIGRAWFFLLQIVDFESGYQGYEHIHSLVYKIDLAVSEDLTQLAIGAGDGFHGLGFLLASQLRNIVPNRDTPLTENEICFLRLILSIMDRVELSAGQDNEVLHPLTAALVPHGIVRILTTMACSLSHTTITDPNIAPHIAFIRSLGILARIFVSRNGYQHLPAALESGLLIALVSGNASLPADTAHTGSDFIILSVLMPFSIYHTVLSKLAAPLLEVAEMEKQDKFLRSSVYRSWFDFRETVDDRLEVLEYLLHHRPKSLKACDNLEVDCSPFAQCQRQLTFVLSAAVSTKSKSLRNVLVVGAFITVLVHVKFVIGVMAGTAKFVVPVHFLSRHPDTPSFTLYEYTVGFPHITVMAVTNAGDLARSPEWHNAVARAAKSGGRMRLNVLRITKDIFKDALDTDFIVPLRAETSTVQDELGCIAREILDVETWKDGELPYGLMTSNGQDVSERLDMLLDSNVERTLEIH